MRLPIQYALTYPEKLTNPWPKLNFNNSLKLEFHKPDMEKFPLFNLAYQLGKKGGNMPAIMNAANEAAVNLFLADQITYSQIVEFVLKAVNYFKYEQLTKIDDIVALDQTVKNYVRNLI
jgi:1-deoxy-D-xylulose-5-phosphate reductoisomerase